MKYCLRLQIADRKNSAYPHYLSVSAALSILKIGISNVEYFPATNDLYSLTLISFRSIYKSS